MILTERESEILALVSDGYTSKQIGYRLGLSAKTVENNRANILAKLWALNMCHAVKIAVGLGIVGLEVAK